MTKKIDKIYAWICTEPDGEQGIPAFQHGDICMPLIGADKERIESQRHIAEQVAADGLPVELVCFSGREVLETINPTIRKKH